MQRLEKMNIVKNRLANINALYHKFVLIFIFKSRKMDGGRGVCYDTPHRQYFAAVFVLRKRILLHASEQLTGWNPQCFISTLGMKLFFTRTSKKTINICNVYLIWLYPQQEFCLKNFQSSYLCRSIFTYSGNLMVFLQKKFLYRKL